MRGDGGRVPRGGGGGRRGGCRLGRRLAAAGVEQSGLVLQGVGWWGLVGLDVAVQVAGWAVSSALKTEKLFDMVGSGTFLALSAASFRPGPVATASARVPAMVGLWAVRLGVFLVHRVHKFGGDTRFDEVKTQPVKFLGYWLLQSVWIAVTCMPMLLLDASPEAPTPASGTAPLALAGAALFALGLATETVADAQKFAFKNDPANRGKFITTGLWALSRHPNYFGEILVWLGVAASAAPALNAQGGPGYAALALASPAMVTLLLTKASGVPILEASADQRWGGTPDYEAYKASTPVLVPSLLSILGGGKAKRGKKASPP